MLEREEWEGCIVSATVLAKVYYVLNPEMGTEPAKKTIEMIRCFENLDVLPVMAEIAIRDAKLRRNYSQAEDRTPYYAEMIHLATAKTVHDCDFLSGNLDFEAVTEVECHVF